MQVIDPQAPAPITHDVEPALCDAPAAQPKRLQQLVADAMKGIADTLVDTARVEVDYIKAAGADRSNFLEAPPGPVALPPASSTPTAHNPFPVSRRHSSGD